MSWVEDTEVWQLIEKMVHDLYPSMTSLCERMFEYNSEMTDSAKGILFGGFGQFTVAYVAAKKEEKPIEEAFAIAMNTVAQNPFFNKMMESSMNMLIDNGVDNMKVNE